MGEAENLGERVGWRVGESCVWLLRRARGVRALRAPSSELRSFGGGEMGEGRVCAAQAVR